MLDYQNIKKRITELCKIFGVDKLEEEKLLEYKINFVKRAFNGERLTAMEKADYFQEIMKACIKPEDYKKYYLDSLKCIDESGELRIFTFFINNETNLSNSIKTIKDDVEHSRIDDKSNIR